MIDPKYLAAFLGFAFVAMWIAVDFGAAVLCLLGPSSSGPSPPTSAANSTSPNPTPPQPPPNVASAEGRYRGMVVPREAWDEQRHYFVTHERCRYDPITLVDRPRGCPVKPRHQLRQLLKLGIRSASRVEPRTSANSNEISTSAPPGILTRVRMQPRHTRRFELRRPETDEAHNQRPRLTKRCSTQLAARPRRDGTHNPTYPTKPRQITGEHPPPPLIVRHRRPRQNPLIVAK